MVFYKCWFSKAQNGYQALMHWRDRQIISQPKHPDLNVNAACLQRHLHSICFCGGRIPLVLEVRVEEEASLSQLWEHKKIAISQYLEIILWIKSLVPSVCDCVTGATWCWQEVPTGLGRKHLSAITKVLFKNENVLPSWIRLDGSDSVLAKMAPPWALLDLISKCKCAVISGLSPVLSLQRKIFPTNKAWRQ